MLQLKIIVKYNRNLALVQVLCCLVVLIASACEFPFSTREPEDPVTEQSSWIQPTSASYVMANLRNAISEKNISNYVRCLADTSNSTKTFSFFADPSVIVNNPGLFERWGKENELNYLNQLMLYLPQDSTSSLKFTSSREDTYQDSVILLQEYELVLNYTCDEDECPRTFKGQAEFRLVRTAEDLWYIYRWSDTATGDASATTWSELKARFGK